MLSRGYGLHPLFITVSFRILGGVVKIIRSKLPVLVFGKFSLRRLAKGDASLPKPGPKDPALYLIRGRDADALLPCPHLTHSHAPQ